MSRAAPASGVSIVAQAVTQAHLEEKVAKAYAAGKECFWLKARGLPFATLVQLWTHALQPDLVKRAFWRGVEDA